MPVILTTQAEVDLWLASDAPKALELQRAAFVLDAVNGPRASMFGG